MGSFSRGENGSLKVQRTSVMKLSLFAALGFIGLGLFVPALRQPDLSPFTSNTLVIIVVFFILLAWSTFSLAVGNLVKALLKS